MGETKQNPYHYGSAIKETFFLPERYNPQFLNYQLIGGTISIMLWHADKAQQGVDQTIRPVYKTNNCNSYWTIKDLLAHLKTVNSSFIAKRIILSAGYLESRTKNFVLNDFVTHLENIIQVLREKGCEETIVTNIPPCAAASLRVQHWRVLQAINNSIRKVCDENDDLFLCNIFQLFCSPKNFERRKEYVVNGVSNYDVNIELYNMMSVHNPKTTDLITFSDKGKQILMLHIKKTIDYRMNQYMMWVLDSCVKTSKQRPSDSRTEKNEETLSQKPVKSRKSVEPAVAGDIPKISTGQTPSEKMPMLVSELKAETPTFIVDLSPSNIDLIDHQVSKGILSFEPNRVTVVENTKSDKIDRLLLSDTNNTADYPKIPLAPAECQTDKTELIYQDAEPMIPHIIESESQIDRNFRGEIRNFEHTPEKSICSSQFIESTAMNSEKFQKIEDEMSKCTAKKEIVLKNLEPILPHMTPSKPDSPPRPKRAARKTLTNNLKHSKRKSKRLSSTKFQTDDRSNLENLMSSEKANGFVDLQSTIPPIKTNRPIVLSKNCGSDETISEGKKTTIRRSLPRRPTFQTDLYFEKLVSNVDFKNVKVGLTTKDIQKDDNEDIPSSNDTSVKILKTAEILEGFAKYEQNTIAYELSKLHVGEKCNDNIPPLIGRDPPENTTSNSQRLRRTSGSPFIDLTTFSDDECAKPNNKRRVNLSARKNKKRKRRRECDLSGAKSIRKPSHKTSRVYNNPKFLSHEFYCECGSCRIGHRQLLRRLSKLVELLEP